MKGKITFFLILLFGFFTFVFIKAFLFNQKNVYGKLKITSSPVASVFIDNVAVGKTPFEERWKVGEYIIKLIPEGVATDTASWSGKVKVEKNLTYVNIDLGSSDLTTAGEIFTMKKSETAKGGKGEIYVETEPSGAIVSLDNDEKGVATLLLEEVPIGVHELSVFMPGFFKRTQKINVYAGYRIYAKFKLAVDQSQKFINQIEEEKKSTESAKKEQKKYVVIKETPTGWLRVRTDASLGASESAKVKVGERYEFLEEKEGWYKIKFNGNKEGVIEGEFDEGWISSSYAKIEE